MKTVFKVIAVLIVFLILFRGSVFRMLIKYNEIGERPPIEINNQELVGEIEMQIKDNEIDLEELVEIAGKLTNKQLQFTTNQASSNPNELVNTQKANCVGYSAMFNSIANYIIVKHNLQNEITATHKIGRLELVGIDLHQFFESPFFKDHDFNEIANKESNQTISIDPSLSDYLWIDRIASKE